MGGVIGGGRFGPEGTSWPGTQACLAHETGDAVAGAGMVAIAQFGSHAWAAVGARVTMGVNGFHFLEKNGVGSGAGARRAFS